MGGVCSFALGVRNFDSKLKSWGWACIVFVPYMPCIACRGFDPPFGALEVGHLKTVLVKTPPLPKQRIPFIGAQDGGEGWGEGGATDNISCHCTYFKNRKPSR